ncbi:MAG: hypothetical protein EOO96_19375 [Pedobacter sp.]|nr:MAG: hypothetical protein EOO96_19375 [Pedobacter sp.]
MKRTQHHIALKLKQLSACLLLLLFLAMPTLQLFHFHDQATELSSQTDGKTVIDKLSEQCKLCDFLSHKQFKEFHLPKASTTLIATQQPIKIYGNYIAINYTFTLNGFTNKGPPSLFC